MVMLASRFVFAQDGKLERVSGMRDGNPLCEAPPSAARQSGLVVRSHVSSPNF